MALTYTPAAEIGSKLPDFSLSTVDDQTYNRQNTEGLQFKVFAFICNHCPYVQAIEDRLVELQKHLKTVNSTLIGVCSNDASDYPEDSKENLQKRAELKNYDFPYLYDEDQSFAKLLGAVCTPDFFVYNEENELIYRGRLDDSWKNADNIRQEELKNAIELWSTNKKVSDDQTPSMGCSIKWK